jgi:hypothetical protein
MAAPTARLVDGVPHHGLAEPAPADIGRDVDGLDHRDAPSAMRQLTQDVELVGTDNALAEPRDVKCAVRIVRDRVERVEVRRERAVASGLGVSAEVVVPEQGEDGGDVLAGRAAENEGRGDGGQPFRMIFSA